MIKRFIEIENDIKFRRYNTDTWELLLKINAKDVTKLLLEMHLLEYKRAQILNVKSKTTSRIVVFSVLDNPNEKMSIVDEINDKFTVKLSFNNLQYITSFLLQYYRDSYAPADHIHLDVSKKSPIGKSGDLIIEAENAAKPMSGEDLTRLLKDL